MRNPELNHTDTPSLVWLDPNKASLMLAERWWITVLEAEWVCEWWFRLSDFTHYHNSEISSFCKNFIVISENTSSDSNLS